MTLAYVGSYTENIYLCNLSEQGKIEVVSEEPAGKGPSFIAASHTGAYLYACLEAEEACAAFRVDRTNGKLTKLNQQSTQGLYPCHLAITDKVVITANYGGGNVTVFQIQADGSLGAGKPYKHEGASPYGCPVGSAQVSPGTLQNPNSEAYIKMRQDAAHAHQVTLSPCKKYVFSCDLGLDAVFQWVLDQDKGTLTPNPAGHVCNQNKGSGPRHMEFSACGKFAYLINELNASITAFRFNAENGTLSALDTYNTLPPGSKPNLNAVPKPTEAGDFDGTVNCCADIHMHPSGKFVYGSNRGNDSICVYPVAEDGKLANGHAQHVDCGGFTPRNFCIHPTGEFVIVGNQNAGAKDDGKGGGHLQTFAVDIKGHGTLKPVGPPVEMKWPSCIVLVGAQPHSNRVGTPTLAANGRRLDGKVIMVSGGTQGCGEAIALALAQEGAAGVAICGRQVAKGEAVAAALTKLGTKALFVKTDLTKVDDIANFLSQCDKAFPNGVDGLVNCAAAAPRGDWYTCPPDLCDWVFQLNLRAPFLLTQGAAKIMKRTGKGGSIVNIGSMNAQGGQSNLPMYASTKGGLVTMTKNAAWALRKDHTRVNYLAVGWMFTPAEDAVLRGEGWPENWIEKADASQAYGRLLRPEDIAKITAHLLSDDAVYQSGSIIDFHQTFGNMCWDGQPTYSD